MFLSAGNNDSLQKVALQTIPSHRDVAVLAPGNLIINALRFSPYSVFHSLPTTNNTQATEKVQYSEEGDKDGLGARASNFLYQSKALLRKRLMTFARDKKMWTFVVLMPFLFVGAGTLTVLSVEVKDQPALALSPQARVTRPKTTLQASFTLRHVFYLQRDSFSVSCPDLCVLTRGVDGDDNVSFVQ